MKRALFPDLSTFSTSLGLLLLRLVAGGAMAQHGWEKMQQPFSWMAHMPNPAPGPLQFLAAFAEFGGGLALIVGLLTPLAMLGWLFTMGYAVYFLASGGAKWVNQSGSNYESALLYLAVAVLFLLAGPGRYSLDSLILNARRPKGQIRAGTDA